LNQQQTGRALDWNNAILHVINLRSFSSLWYWIMVAVVWSTVSHWVLGVPFDMIQRAKRHGGQAEIDLSDMVRINVNRQLTTASVAGVWLIGILFFVLSALAGLGFLYGVELAQAIFLLALPMSFVGAMAVSTSRLIAATNPQGEALFAILLRHRLWTQIIGMIAIFVTGLYGMFQNLAVVRGL
tara:strand:+ start:25840 stop:26391 length:552 start_codon:yes stop_codon:yes gene_type:complete